ncbi:MAG: SGNH/GDSL hydrolase family protein [Clostridiaceae bacterium]|nr:SGNH/GDSL hydrolase family protein [Clostridiaceae bacterium]
MKRIIKNISDKIFSGLSRILDAVLTNIKLSMLPGNASQYHIKNVDELPESPLKGKTIIFLGSSVTYGSASLGTSFTDYIGKRNRVKTIKEAVSGTTLVTDGDTCGTSYVSRIKSITPEIKADLFICQLSTNDSTQGKTLGEVSESFNMDSFNTDTIAGAIEYIIAYAKKTWNCPVVFFTNPRYDSPQYGKMVDMLYKIQKKWDIGIIDLWNNEKFNNISKEEYSLYMFDSIHPTQAGYLKWWTPVIEEYLFKLFGI